MTITCKFSKHGLKRMEERNIKREWVEMKIDYDKKVDALYIQLLDDPVSDIEEINNGDIR